MISGNKQQLTLTSKVASVARVALGTAGELNFWNREGLRNRISEKVDKRILDWIYTNLLIIDLKDLAEPLMVRLEVKWH